MLKQKKKITWDFIAHAIFSYVVIEADVLKAGTKLTEETILRRKNVCYFWNSKVFALQYTPSLFYKEHTIIAKNIGDTCYKYVLPLNI